MVIDASVWVAAQFPGEPDHLVSAECLRRALGGPDTVTLPWLAWVECVAAVTRKTGDGALAQEVGQHLRALSMIRWIDLDEATAAAAVDVGAQCRLRATDAIYVGAARLHGAPLITLDQEVRQRADGLLPCLAPGEWLATTT